MTQAPRLLVIGATGWYGKTLIYEYVLFYGLTAALRNLRLYASKPSLLRLDISTKSLFFDVHPLCEIRDKSFEDYDGLVWYAFLLRTKLPLIGLDAYRSVNDEIAASVFNCLALNSNLKVTFFSSGVAFSPVSTPRYEQDPYVYLKLCYQRQLSELGPLLTFYPFATLGRFVSDYRIFAASSFLHQAITESRIKITAGFPVVRSYGSVHDFSRLLLRLYEINDWSGDSVPEKIVPVTHTLDLFQLACEVASSLGRSITIISDFDPNAPPSVYTAPDYSFGAQLSCFGIKPTTLRQQLLDMAEGDAFQVP